MTDYTKFPHNRGGFSGQGRADARELDNNEVAFLKKRRPGSIAEKKGEFLYVTAIDQNTDTGFLSLGNVDAQYRIVGSTNARGTFKRLGTAPDVFTSPGLGFYGNGYAIVPGPSIEQATEVDFDGREYQIRAQPLYLTRNGVSVVFHYAFMHHVRPSLWNEGGSVGSGAWSGDPRTFVANALGMTMIDGQHAPLFIVDEGGDNQSIGAIPYLTNQLAITPIILRLGPARLLAIHRYLRPNYTPSAVDVGACPGIFFSLSNDAGRTWEFKPVMGSMWNDLADLLSVIPTGSSFGDLFNSGIGGIAVRCYPVSAERAVIMASVPRGVITGPGPTYGVNWRTYLGWIDSATGEMTESATLYDGPSASKAASFFNADGVILEDGVRIFTRPTSPTNDEWNEPRRVLFTVDGSSYSWEGYMPLPNYKTGLVIALSKDKLVCPMYDGDHSLFESTDKGATWKKRAVIYRGAPAPDPENHFLSVVDFAVVTFLRFNGRAAPQFPPSPWITDSRIDPP